jgi:deoxyadenosine/deoxycytidine kinase
MAHPIIIGVDGGIGVGKTVYINMICKKLTQRGWRVTIVKEPVDKWRESGILNLFYQDPKRWAYHFQTVAFHDRIVENIEAFKAHGINSDVFILERTPFTDNLFMEVLHDDGFVTEMEYKDYGQWWKLWYELMPYSPNMFIYLRPDIDIQMTRMEERNRIEETSKNGKGGVSREYQEKLVAKHDAFFKDDMVEIGLNSYVPCVKLISNENYRDDLTVQEKFTDHFESLLISLKNIKELH